MTGSFSRLFSLIFMVCLCMAAVAPGVSAMQCDDNYNGTVTDNMAGLMWMKETPTVRMPWEDARNFAENLVLGGHSDWRLPSIDELRQLYRSTCLEIMKIRKDWYWSSTEDGSRNKADRLNFRSGNVLSGLKNFSYYMLPVRRAGSLE
ncbi:MAG: DUF1566 domain-containing protein [Desulfonatronovibrionaceae bacterium]